MARHHLRKPRPDRLTLTMAAITTLLLAAGAWAILHPDLGGTPGCTPIPGTSRLDCGE